MNYSARSVGMGHTVGPQFMPTPMPTVSTVDHRAHRNRDFGRSTRRTRRASPSASELTMGDILNLDNDVPEALGEARSASPSSPSAQRPGRTDVAREKRATWILRGNLSNRRSEFNMWFTDLNRRESM